MTSTEPMEQGHWAIRLHGGITLHCHDEREVQIVTRNVIRRGYFAVASVEAPVRDLQSI
jgi:hypothetical protein